MPFITDFPKDAVHALVTAKEQDAAHIALGAYEVTGFLLGQYFGPTAWPVGLSFNILSKIGAGTELAQAVQTRAQTLKGSGLGVAAIIFQLLMEFGPKILSFIQTIKAALAANDTPTPAAS